MEFKVDRKIRRQIHYPTAELNIARQFAKKVYEEMGAFVKGVILFGSVVGREKQQDIDLLVILDDVTLRFTPDLVQTYRIIMEKIVADISKERLHVQSMKYTSFWEYVRVGDPVAINILRYGISLVDTGFFDPLQALLDQGRIRPSKEAVYTYFTMAPASLTRSKQHMLSATVDLYWAVIDSAHAALMKMGEVPPSPNHVADRMERTLVKQRLVSKKSANTMRFFYKLFKGIVHRDIQNITGKQYDAYKKKALSFVKEMQKIVEKKD
jgi:predicted nucleotidyltransferase